MDTKQETENLEQKESVMKGYIYAQYCGFCSMIISVTSKFQMRQVGLHIIDEFKITVESKLKVINTVLVRFSSYAQDVNATFLLFTLTNLNEYVSLQTLELSTIFHVSSGRNMCISMVYIVIRQLQLV